MILKSASAHAIRAMIYLALQPEGKLCKAREIAAKGQIPSPFLGKILQQLRQHRLLESVRGSKGGYRLEVPPAKIRMIEIIRAVESDVDSDRCILRQGHCSMDQHCALHVRMEPVRAQFFEVMENTTLAEISRQQPQTESSGLFGPVFGEANRFAKDL